MYAYIFLNLSKLGIDVAGESHLVGYPSQFPDVSMMSWKTSKPNSRYWVLKLLKDHFKAADKLVETHLNSPDVEAQAFLTDNGKKLLLINKRNKEASVELPSGTTGAVMYSVDVTTRENPPLQTKLTGSEITLKPFAVAVINFKD